MNTPEVIYLQVCGECYDNDCEECNFDDLAEITWCKDRIYDNDVAYFSEESVKQYLRHLIDEINKNYSFVHYDIDKTIDEFIGRLKGDEK